jgi:hypothetical protein
MFCPLIPHCVSFACISRSASVSSISKNRNPSLRSIIHHFSHSLARFFFGLSDIIFLVYLRVAPGRDKNLGVGSIRKGHACCRAVPWLRRLLNDPSLRRSRPVHVRFVVEKVPLDRLFSECFGFPLSATNAPNSLSCSYEKVKRSKLGNLLMSHEFTFGNQIENYFRLV